MTKKQFIQIYDLYVDDTARFLSYYTKDRTQLEDLIQDVFLKLWKYRENIDWDNKFLKTYILKTARNVALTYLEEQKKNPIETREYFLLEKSEQKETRELNYKELNVQYREALDSAPNKAREVYMMNREEGLTYKEIAIALEISPRTVEIHISKVLRILRKELKEFQF